MVKKNYCQECNLCFATKHLRQLHEKFAHQLLPEPDQDYDVFLPEPEPVEETVNHSYLQIIERKAKRFPAYQRYLGHGKDFYNERGMNDAINSMRNK